MKRKSKKPAEPSLNVTQQMVKFSREKALFRKVGVKDPLTNRYPRVLNRVVAPAPMEPRDRSLRGKARIKARKAANKRYYRTPVSAV